jgi:hypothetical protein
MTSIESATESNGVHTEKKTRGRRSMPPVESQVLAALQDARGAAIAHRIALRHELALLDEILDGDARPGLAAEDKPAKLVMKSPRKPRAAKSAAPAPATPKRTRTPRADGLPAKVLHRLAECKDGTSANDLAFCTGAKPAAVHGALNALLKAGKVTSSGTRKARVWSVAT